MWFNRSCHVWAVLATVVLAPALCAARGTSPLLEYLGQRATRMAAELPPMADTAEAWETQRRQTLAKLSELLGLPEREPMKAAVTSQKEQDGLVIEDVAYLWAERAYVSANVVRRKDNAGRRPAIVVPPGWLGHYTLPYYRGFVFHMAKLGYVVLFIDDPHIGRRAAPKAGLYAVASAAGTQVMGIQVFDTLRGFDYLLTRADVDPGRIGVAGLCQGSEQTWLAGALESRFQYVVPVCGTTTYEAWTQMPAADGVHLSDPSPYVANVLAHTDWDRINACIAPRPVLVCSNSGDNWWPPDGYDQVVRAMNRVYSLHDAEDRFRHVLDLRSHDLTPYIPEIAPWIEARVAKLQPSDAKPMPCDKPEEPDFKMLGYFHRLTARRAESFPQEFTAAADWQAYREKIVAWLDATCNLDSTRPGESEAGKSSTVKGLVIQDLQLSLDVGLRIPAVLVRPQAASPQRSRGIILSHGGLQSARSGKIMLAVRRLATTGYWVVVPAHVSTLPAGPNRLEGRELVSFYGAADATALPPLALRVADDLAAFRYLAAQPEVDKQQIVIAGSGLGGIDACLAALLEPKIAGVASVDVTTVRDWAENTAPSLIEFTHPMPYLPDLLTVTDLDYLFAAIAPRPLLIARLADGPTAGFQQIAERTAEVYGLLGAEKSLLTVGSNGLALAVRKSLPPGVQRQIADAAVELLPEPHAPGILGTVEGLQSRPTTDTTAGIIWIVCRIDGYEGAFLDGGYRLKTWSFFNDNGTAQQGRAVTPLIFKQQGSAYRLIAVGKTRTNDGDGLQPFEFEPVEGTDAVEAGCYFGWHSGDLAGNVNAGVVEYGDDPRCTMTILTADGQTGGQKIVAGKTYRMHLQLPRRYSVLAVSQREERNAR